MTTSVAAKANRNLITSTSLEQIKHDFQQQFFDIQRFLTENKRKMQQDPQVLLDFVDSDLMNVWSSKLTIRAMVGVKIWKKLSKTEREELTQAYRETMQRYLFETMQKFEGQQALVDGLQLTSKGNKGWLTAKLVLETFPDLTVDLKLYRPENHWLIYDFRFQGISFIKLKQHQYQSIINEHGVAALIQDFNDKNQVFRKSLSSEPND
ncbi:phospholipid-binding protein MlaC [Kangiella sp. TOML190]|uniref:MlaC/ttg2D family ABC transporter substrate-binding protein n=1 Tax=Kangiella sp. TOML190 TaxID=2931351 RepID=UPI0020420AF0|nr:ABC transporter substrate-binding protein [Kangiella sp. TOML190]